MFQACFGILYSQNDTCSIEFSVDSSMIPPILLTAVTGTPPFLYEWHNGRQTDKIRLDRSDIYNVTITDAKGCISFATYDYFQCDVQIIADTLENKVQLRGEAIGTPPFQYFWSNNTFGMTATPNNTGNYSLTITDATGCNAAVEYEYLGYNTSNNRPKTITKNKIWQVKRESGFSGESTYTNYQFLKDTIINNQTYEQLFYKRISPIATDWTPSTDFLREDNTGKIYLLNELQTESVFYDFSLKIADTFHMMDGHYDCSLIVTNIDSVSITTGEKRKRLTLIAANDPDPIVPWYGFKYWVEGIGSLSSLIDYGATCYTDANINMQCFYDDNGLGYENKETGNCLLTSTFEKSISTIKIFPNPTQSLVFVNSPDEILNLQLFDYLGRALIIEHENSAIDLSPLPKGIYFIKIQTNQQQYFVERIIKN